MIYGMIKYQHINIIMIQVLLVTGGARGSSGYLLDSTEISPPMGTHEASWRTLTTAKLPSPRAGLRAATINNTVFIFGESKNQYTQADIPSIFHLIICYILSGGKNTTSDLDSILSYNAIGKSWRPAGQMLVPRSGHAVSQFDVSRDCP